MASAGNLQTTAYVPPGWSVKLLDIPMLGGYLNAISQAAAYGSALEDNADFISKDLSVGDGSKWICRKVGVK
ncbi:hypothetical protein N7478_010006 [Penicillium angulare]|uniref:uncharacterized protein n=1 Tax=Penicillium angulare TaxID=116970 RepID=UPI00254240E4|nr:uncharacterized protein N7478_010006 [Penicillium angulare]KAJ5267198.1 hypothetical protein N7478_010006 [Penicillium angulare]